MKTINERIADFIKTKNEIEELSAEGEDFDYSVPMEMMQTALEIIQELQSQLETSKKENEELKKLTQNQLKNTKVEE